MDTENKEHTGMGQMQRDRGIGTDYCSGHLNPTLSIHVTLVGGLGTLAKQDKILQHQHTFPCFKHVIDDEIHKSYLGFGY
jgi:hypothetical protein